MGHLIRQWRTRSGSRPASGWQRKVERALPAYLKLGGVVLAGAALIALEMRHIVSWSVQTDELQYVRLAISAGSDLTLFPGIHMESYGGVSHLYSIMLSPAYALFDTPRAFKAAHALNALAFTSTAVPAYLLAREVVSDRAAALAVAALSVVTPWAALTLIIWTESLAYPMFIWAVWAMQRSMVRPTVRADLLAFALLIAAFLTRTQFLVLAVAFPVALLLHEVGYALTRAARRKRLSAVRGALIRTLIAHPLVWGAVALVAVLGVGGLLAPLLGPYQTTVGASALLPAGWSDIALMHVAILGVASGVIPMVLAVAWLPIGIVRPVNKGLHAFAVLAVIVSVTLFVQAASFVVQYASSTPSDRYFFYIMPLLFIGAAAFLLEGPRHWAPALVASGALAWVVEKASFEQIFNNSPASRINPTLASLAEGLEELPFLGDLSVPSSVQLIVVAIGVVVALAIRFVSHRRLAVALLIALLMFGVAETRHVLKSVRVSQVLFPAGRNWVDRAPRDGGAVGLAPSPVVEGNQAFEARENWWDVEFWNRSIERVYSYEGATTHTPFPLEELDLDRQSGRLHGRFLPRLLVVAKMRPDLELRGRQVGEYGRLKLVDMGARPQALWTVEGLTPRLGGIRPGGHAVLSIYPGDSAQRPERWRVTFRLAPPRRLRSQEYRANAGTAGRQAGRVRRKGAVDRSFLVCAGPGPARIKISSGTAGAEVPLTVPPTSERIGLLVSEVRAVPRPGSCRP